MDCPFYMSRRTVHFFRRRLLNCENVAYSIPSRTKEQKDRRTKEQISYSRGASRYDRLNVSGQCPKGSNSLKLAATLEDWGPRHYNDYLRLDGQEQLSDPSSRQRSLPGSNRHVCYLSFSQRLCATSAVCSFKLNKLFTARYFSTSAAVRSLSLVKLTLLII
jgi:hypothetical protein